MQRIATALVAAAAPAFLTLTFLIGSTPDEEEFRWGFLSTVLRLQALVRGSLGTWTSTLGFGMPQPMVPNFDLHPLSPLLLVLPADSWARLLVIAHTLLGALGMWRLARFFGIAPIVAAICVLTFLFATPTQNYVLSDFWPSHYVMWTSAPWLLLIALRLLDATGPDLPTWGVRLGLAAGLVLATTHPGHVPVYAVVVLAVGAARWRAAASRWRWLCVAGLMALAIAGPSLLQLASERAIFSPELGIEKLPEPLPPGAVRDVFLRPFTVSDHPWQIDLVNRGTRTLFFGGAFALLGLLGLARTSGPPLFLAIGVVLGTVLLFTPLLPLSFVSRFHFRDPLLLCAIPLAGITATSLLTRPLGRLVAVPLLLAQIGLVTAAALPFFDGAQDRAARRGRSFRGAIGDAPTMEALEALMPSPGRLAYSPQIDSEVSERRRLADGLGVNAPAFRGRAIVNGSYKGVSSDVLWPDDRLFYGRIRLPRQLVASDDALDLLGIRYLLANADEAVAAGLHERGRIQKDDGTPAVLYENEDASPGAFVVSASPPQLPVLQPYQDCINARLLCKDLGPLARVRGSDPLSVVRDGSRIAVTVRADPASRTLILAEMFRPEWRAGAGGTPLETLSVGPGLLAVVLPAGVDAVTLDHHSGRLEVATLLSWGTLCSGLFVCCLDFWRRRSRHAPPPRSA